MSRRKTTDDEKALFRQVIDEPRPLKAATRKPLAKPKKPIARAVSSLDGNTAEKLKRGAREPEVRVDLHGLTEARAHQRLLSFLRGAQKKGVRLVLVITGIGNPRREESAEWMVARAPSPSATPSWAGGPARQSGVLKQMVPRWLNESEFTALVSGSGPAHRRHGGDGALYVYLRKL
jgi:DNA-nicking Smr family endonuclease